MYLKDIFREFFFEDVYKNILLLSDKLKELGHPPKSLTVVFDGENDVGHARSYSETVSPNDKEGLRKAMEKCGNHRNTFFGHVTYGTETGLGLEYRCESLLEGKINKWICQDSWWVEKTKSSDHVVKADIGRKPPLYEIEVSGQGS